MNAFQQYMVEYKHLLGEGMSWSLIDSFIDSSVFFRIFLKIELNLPRHVRDEVLTRTC
jgi:hypothetical protein